MRPIISLAAAGALLFSAASAEIFDIRSQLLQHKFGDLFPRVVRRQDDTLNSIESLTPEVGSIITSVASVSGLSQWTTTFVPSRTASPSSSEVSTASAVSTGTASRPPYTPNWSKPEAALYVINMCMPNFFNDARARRIGINLKVDTESEAILEVAKLAISLGGSPFPCEQAIYIEFACHANATKPVDYLAEQQCFCGSTYFAAMEACNSCISAHGLTMFNGTELSSQMSSFSGNVCDATPVPGGILAAAKTDLPVPTAIAVGMSFAPKSVVKHLSSTAVSLYADWPSLSIPAITGEATARATTWGNWQGASSAASGYAAPVVGVILGAVALGATLVL